MHLHCCAKDYTHGRSRCGVGDLIGATACDDFSSVEVSRLPGSAQPVVGSRAMTRVCTAVAQKVIIVLCLVPHNQRPDIANDLPPSSAADMFY